MVTDKIWHRILKYFSQIYGLLTKYVQSYYQKSPNRRHRVNARVISVGNITWGGTGKTPLVMMLARSLTAKGKRVAVLTRGYGGDEAHELKNVLTGVPVFRGGQSR